MTMIRAACPYDIIEIDPKNPIHVQALDKAYNEIYLERFKDPSVIEPYELWLKHISISVQEKQQHIVFVGGENLDDPKKMKVWGISVAIYFPDIGIGLLAYNATHPDILRSENIFGLGKMMMHKRKRALIERHRLMYPFMNPDKAFNEIRGIFTEIKDPSISNQVVDGICNEERASRFINNGGTKIPFNYAAPLLNEKGDVQDGINANMLLLSYQLNYRRMPPPRLSDIQAYIKIMFGGDETHEGFKSSSASLMSLLSHDKYVINKLDPASTRITHDTKPNPLTEFRKKQNAQPRLRAVS